MDAKTSKADSIKESGAAKVQALIQKSEEIVKEVNLNGFPSWTYMYMVVSYEIEISTLPLQCTEIDEHWIWIFFFLNRNCLQNKWYNRTLFYQKGKKKRKEKLKNLYHSNILETWNPEWNSEREGLGIKIGISDVENQMIKIYIE